MLIGLLLSNTGFYIGFAIEGFFAIAATVLLVLLLVYGLPKKREKQPKPVKEKKEKPEPTKYALAYVGGEATGDTPAIEYYTKGTKISLKLNMFSTPVGKQFDGWSDGMKRYLPSARFTMPAQAVTLTAQWKEIKKEETPKYSLVYVSGGAKGHSPAVEQYEKGAKITLKSNMFTTPDEKEFDGWFDGTNKYLAGNEFVMPAQAVTFTAQWKDIVKEEEPKKAETEQPVVTTAQIIDTVDSGDDTNPDGSKKPIIINVYNTTNGTNGSATAATTETTAENKETVKTVEKVIAVPIEDDGPEFSNLTIGELYEMLSPEQKRYYDTLKKAALAKPQAKLTVAKNYENIKVGKRSILKLRIRKLITVGEYALENDILKEFRRTDPNKAGNSKIKVRPTLVAVTDESTLETALDMIDLVHKQILES